MTSKPLTKPNCPNFSSGPCAKRPNWNVANLATQSLGRSHRSSLGGARLKLAIDLMKEILGVPENYRLGIVPGSDTGAVEMALWSLLGQRGVDLLAWETFGSGWVADVTKQLKLEDVRVLKAPYGELPDLGQVDTDRDVVFTWNGTTSGVKVPNGDWIKSERKGLTICDATSAVFAMDMPWDKLDVTTFSWQKVLGGEGAHGVIVLSPKAVERLESYTPKWPMPKVFRLTTNGKLTEGIFKGDTINTPSMLCVEDLIDALTWAKEVGGLKGLIKRSQASFDVLNQWVKSSHWCAFLAQNEAQRSNTSVCFVIKDPKFKELSPENQEKIAKSIGKLLDKEGVAYDLGAYRDAPLGLRIWCGATVEASDVQALCPWLDWAYTEALAQA